MVECVIYHLETLGASIDFETERSILVTRSGSGEEICTVQAGPDGGLLIEHRPLLRRADDLIVRDIAIIGLPILPVAVLIIEKFRSGYVEPVLFGQFEEGIEHAGFDEIVRFHYAYEIPFSGLEAAVHRVPVPRVLLVDELEPGILGHKSANYGRRTIGGTVVDA